MGEFIGKNSITISRRPRISQRFKIIGVKVTLDLDVKFGIKIAAERQETQENYSINKCLGNISKCSCYDASTLMRFDRNILLFS